MFAMFDVPADRKAAQLALADATMSPSFQSAFNVVKGSVPARMDVSDTAFDMCGKKGIADVKKANADGKFVGSMAQNYAQPPAVAGAYHDVVTKFFHGEIKSSDAAVTELGQGDQQRQVGQTAPPRAHGRGGPYRWSGFPDERPRASSMTHDPCAAHPRDRRPIRVSRIRERLQNILPRLVLAPSFLLVLVFVYGFNLWTLFLSFTNSKAFATTKLIGLAQLSEAVELDLRDRPAVELVHGDRQHGHFRRPLCRVLSLSRPDAGDSARPENPRRGNLAADLSVSAGAFLHRHRHRVEAVSRSAASDSRKPFTTGAGRASSSTGSSTRG